MVDRLRREDLQFYYLVKRTIENLAPLRTDQRKTEEYTNLHLFADAQYIAINKGNKNNVPYSVFASQFIRTEIINILKEDDSFIFAYNILVAYKNGFTTLNTCQTGELKEESSNTIQLVQDLICNYREDYPKVNLADYLLDEHNEAFYNNRRLDLGKEDNWWLDAFNRSYALFDEMRTELDFPFEAKKQVTRLELDDEVLQHTVVEIVHNMTEHYDFQLSEEQQKKMKLLSSEIKDFLAGIGNGYTRQREFEEMKERLKQLEEEKEMYRNKYEQLEQNMRGMTTAEQDLVFYYIFNELQMTFDNSTKVAYIRFIEKVTGKNPQNIKNHLDIDFDNPHTQKYLRNVHLLFMELFPHIAQKVLNDLKG